ncbi:MAG TPA: hypothetical protein VNY51_09610 [Candidatus Dormibacteraeota bacterium]|jgi:hypothetical protein|nr:hypothetical protein [Candidatus Dormibacteraeota bacterium]
MPDEKAPTTETPGKLGTPSGVSPEFRFAYDTFKKIFVFLFIALSAAGIYKIVEILERNNFPAYITDTLSFVEVLILLADVVWFLRALTIELLQSLEGLFKGGTLTRVMAAAVLIVFGAVLSPHLKHWVLALLHAKNLR